jgi:hypothetical protein
MDMNSVHVFVRNGSNLLALPYPRLPELKTIHTAKSVQVALGNHLLADSPSKCASNPVEALVDFISTEISLKK